MIRTGVSAEKTLLLLLLHPRPAHLAVCGCLGPMCSNVLSLSSYYLYLEHFLFTLFKKLVRIWTNEIICNLYQLLFHCILVFRSTFSWAEKTRKVPPFHRDEYHPNDGSSIFKSNIYVE